MSGAQPGKTKEWKQRQLSNMEEVWMRESCSHSLWIPCQLCGACGNTHTHTGTKRQCRGLNGLVWGSMSPRQHQHTLPPTELDSNTTWHDWCVCVCSVHVCVLSTAVWQKPDGQTHLAAVGAWWWQTKCLFLRMSLCFTCSCSFLHTHCQTKLLTNA